MNTSQSPRTGLWSKLAAVVCYAVAMGMLEAICVVYLRQLLGPKAVAELDVTTIQRWPIESCASYVRSSCWQVWRGWPAGIRPRVSASSSPPSAFGTSHTTPGSIFGPDGPSRCWDGTACSSSRARVWLGACPVLISLEFVASCVVLIGPNKRAGPSAEPSANHHAAVGLDDLDREFHAAGRLATHGKCPASYPWWALALGMFPSLAAVWPSQVCRRSTAAEPSS